TDLVAGATEGGGIRERPRVLDPHELGREDGPDRSRVDRVIRVAAGPLVDRADVQAGAAADAVEGLAPGRVGEDAGPAVVQQDEVELLGPVARGHPGPERGIRVHSLPGGGAGEE